MDPFKTPPPHFAKPSSAERFIRMSKQQVLKLFQNIEFEEIFIPAQSATEHPDDTLSFLEAVGKAFIAILIQSYPKKSSPKKLLQISDTQSQESPIPNRVTPPTADTLAGGTVTTITRPGEDLRSTMRNAAIASIMAKPGSISRFQFHILTLDDHIAPVQAITPPSFLPESEPSTFRYRSDVEELLQDEINRLSESSHDPYTIMSVSTAPDGCNHPYVYLEAVVKMISGQQIHPAFKNDKYTIKKFALIDSGADVCIICDDILGIQLEKPQGVYFAFKYIASALYETKHLDLSASRGLKWMLSPKLFLAIHCRITVLVWI